MGTSAIRSHSNRVVVDLRRFLRTPKELYACVPNDITRNSDNRHPRGSKPLLCASLEIPTSVEDDEPQFLAIARCPEGL
jgi:hypothetical protein